TTELPMFALSTTNAMPATITSTTSHAISAMSRASRFAVPIAAPAATAAAPPVFVPGLLNRAVRTSPPTSGYACVVPGPASALTAEDVHGARNHQPHRHQRRDRLNAHHELGGLRQRHRVGRAEGGRVRERHIEIVHEPRPPARRREARVLHLGELEVGQRLWIEEAKDRAAAVHLP